MFDPPHTHALILTFCTHTLRYHFTNKTRQLCTQNAALRDDFYDSTEPTLYDCWLECNRFSSICEYFSYNASTDACRLAYSPSYSFPLIYRQPGTNVYAYNSTTGVNCEQITYMPTSRPTTMSPTRLPTTSPPTTTYGPTRQQTTFRRLEVSITHSHHHTFFKQPHPEAYVQHQQHGQRGPGILPQPGSVHAAHLCHRKDRAFPGPEPAAAGAADDYGGYGVCGHLCFGDGPVQLHPVRRPPPPDQHQPSLLFASWNDVRRQWCAQPVLCW